MGGVFSCGMLFIVQVNKLTIGYLPKTPLVNLKLLWLVVYLLHVE
jgi:hypothetical protein